MSPRAGAASSLAPRRVPEAYIRAEVASFPLTSPCAFEEALTELDPALETGEPSGEKTSRLWRACEETLVQHGAAWSLDRIIAVRDRTWFTPHGGRLDPDECGIPMHEYLRRLASEQLEVRPGTTTVDSSETSTLDAEAHYRWLTFALPEDMLLAAVDADCPPLRASLDPPRLVRRLVDHGVADVHLHVAAGMDYPLLWAASLAQLASPSLEPGALKGPGAPFGEGKDLVQWLLAAAIARVVLVEYLIQRDARTDTPNTLVAFLDQRVCGWPWLPQRRRALAVAFGALERGRWPEGGDAWFPALRDLYADLHPTGVEAATARPPEKLEDIWRSCDPIAARLDLARPGAGERFFVARSLAHLASVTSGEKDPLFTRLFWQALRVRCQHYRAIVQRPMTAGLQWFIRFAKRVAPLRDPLRRVRPEAAYRSTGLREPIAALEMRTSPADTPTEIAQQLLDFVVSWRNVREKAPPGREPELGLVYHFIKERDPENHWTDGTPRAFWRGTHAEPRTARRAQDVFCNDGRFIDYFASVARAARALGELLRAVPAALSLVRGLDVANDELAVPTWVLVPLYRYVLEQADLTSARLAPDGPPSLRLTAHVGEDYRHLMEGLRRIYECVHYVLRVAPGGRLGHATALGVEPRLWAESVGAVIVPIEDRLIDLVLEWRLYTRYRVRSEFGAAAPPSRPEQVANLIRGLSEHVFGKSYEPEHLAELHHVLHQFLAPPLNPLRVDGGLDTFRRAVRQFRRTHVESSDAVRFPRQVGHLLESYIDDEKVFLRGQELIDVPIDSSEIAALAAVQQAVRCGVAENGVVVEVNPSSNLLIGDLLDLRNHPLLRLYPIEPDERLAPVSIAVGSDDPVTFGTSLVREYTLLYQAARAAGYPDRVVLEWLEAVRATSMDARFTLAWREGEEERLEGALRAYLRERRPEST